MMIFWFTNEKYGKSNEQTYDGVTWYVNAVKSKTDNDENDDVEEDSYLNVYLGAKNLLEDEFLDVELTASILHKSLSSNLKNKYEIIPAKQSFKLLNETFLFPLPPLIMTGSFFITVQIQSLKKGTTSYSISDPLSKLANLQSISESQETEVENNLEYIKFPNCSFGDPSFIYSDLVIQIGKLKLFCHSQVLSLNSPVLYDIIDEIKQNNKVQDGKYVLELFDIDNFFDFQSFLYLIYYQRNYPNGRNVENILYYADKFRVNIVKEACEDFLLDGTHSFSDETLVALAYRFNLKKLKDSLDSRMHFLKVEDIFCSEHYQKASQLERIEFCERTIMKLKLK